MVRIVTDTSSMFTPETGKEHGLTVFPLNVTIAGKTYQDMVDIKTPEFVDIINQGNIPTSSQPSPADIIEVYEEATAENPIIHIAICDGLSGAYQSACGIRETMDNKEHIHVFNTATLCGPQWVMVRAAVKMAAEGASVEEIITMLEDMRAHQKSILLPQDFGYLRRGGRLSPAAATVGALLKMVPVMTQTSDGRQLARVGIARNFRKAAEMGMTAFDKEGIADVEDCIITCSHSLNKEQAQEILDMLKEKYPNCKEYHLFDLTPAFTVQGGPLCVAFQFVTGKYV